MTHKQWTWERVSKGEGSFADARYYVYLSVEQAASLSGIPAARLTAIESGADVTVDEWAMLATMYNVTDFATPRPPGRSRDVLACETCRALSVEGGEFRHTRQCKRITEARARKYELHAYGAEKAASLEQLALTLLRSMGMPTDVTASRDVLNWVTRRVNEIHVASEDLYAVKALRAGRAVVHEAEMLTAVQRMLFSARYALEKR